MLKKVTGGIWLVAALAMLGAMMLSTPGFAQTKFSGKDPFPKKLKKSGSYQQVSNITIPAKNTTTDAVDITASNVTVDLQGYTIMGPGSGSGIGINASTASNVTIENGIILNMGGAGIVCGDNCILRNMQVLFNGGNGIQCGGACLVTSSIIANSGLVGLDFGDATSGYSNNVLNFNTGGSVTNGTNLGANVCNGGACP